LQPTVHHTSWQLRKDGSGLVCVKVKATAGVSIIFGHEPLTDEVGAPCAFCLVACLVALLAGSGASPQ
jgi:hypothetical protein